MSRTCDHCGRPGRIVADSGEGGAICDECVKRAERNFPRIPFTGESSEGIITPLAEKDPGNRPGERSNEGLEYVDDD